MLYFKVLLNSWKHPWKQKHGDGYFRNASDSCNKSQELVGITKRSLLSCLFLALTCVGLCLLQNIGSSLLKMAVKKSMAKSVTLPVFDYRLQRSLFQGASLI